MRAFLISDCGSTNTKTVLIEKRDCGFVVAARGEASTTVEPPYNDITIGVLNSIKEIERVTGYQLLGEGEQGILTPMGAGRGVDLYLSTSSAGGGLQLVVSGVTPQFSASSARRAALGAGAMVLDVFSVDDGRSTHEKIELLRELRPDIFILAGGTEGGTVRQVLASAELLLLASPVPRWGDERLPVIYTGNSRVREEIQRLLGSHFDVLIVENVRPDLDKENVVPVRQAIHDLFLNHVMTHAPGFKKLGNLSSRPVMPTPAAFGLAIQKVSELVRGDVLAFDIGGATTDVFSVVKGVFRRTVSANLGMSYSAGNVLKETGAENIRRWIPYSIHENDVRDWIRNKMIYPTIVPQTILDLALEQALAQEALRLALQQHLEQLREEPGKLRVGSRGFRLGRDESSSLPEVDVIIGSGGPFTHAPRPIQAAMMLLNAVQPEGLTRLVLDQHFMLPHLGLLSTVEPGPAMEVLSGGALKFLGTAISIGGSGREEELAATISIDMSGGVRKLKPVAITTRGKSYSPMNNGGMDQDAKGAAELVGHLMKRINWGQVLLVPLPAGQSVEVKVTLASKARLRGMQSRRVRTKVEGGDCGVIIDARGRPLTLPHDDKDRLRLLRQWVSSLRIYPS